MKWRRDRGSRWEGEVTAHSIYTHLALKFVAVNCLGCKQKEKQKRQHSIINKSPDDET